MSSSRSILGILLGAMIIAGCSTRSGDLAYNPPGFTAPDAPPAALDNAQYRLSPGDVINIKVYELDSVSGDQTVDGNGRVNFPLVGVVIADGKTTDQFGIDLAQQLQQKYLQSPHVVVTLKSAVSRIVTVDGSVKTPGIYQITPNTTLLQTIALAKGADNNANLKRVVIFRQIGGQRQAAAFDLTTIRRGQDPDPKIYPNDLVVVDGSGVQSAYRTLLRSIPLAGFFLRL